MAFVWCPEQIHQMKAGQNDKYNVQSYQVLPRFGLEPVFIQCVDTYSFKWNQKRIKNKWRDENYSGEEQRYEKDKANIKLVKMQTEFANLKMEFRR